jgi:hypothetical protein
VKQVRGGLVLGAVVWAAGALAHHPGSHAFRQADGRVRVEAVAMASDACTLIDGIRTGTPPGVAPPPGSAPVTVTLKQHGQMCAAVVTAVRAEALLDIPRGAAQILVYVQGADGSLAASERVPIR